MLDRNAYREELKGCIGDIGKLSPDTLRGYAMLGNAGAKTGSQLLVGILCVRSWP